ncbi:MULTISPECIES: pyridoxal phosphate-dependent decarboxylase family protein [Kordiimonas]|jgi:glutamate/tyrosine decarboxylase-like PLP-dependent enzyme|uniref:Pyridoxal-dependent decarboxylase conserved domain-containing protein n=1 Tax=Kordiimonas lacus TaxID=637679 RepID=A0A1G7BHB6_9PROT|nr:MULTISPECIES: pyridoxal-dependent decarboxylase [Kordiimonas]SDE26287.1 Pyridoxal-dependent decarboxylase conserved domain-containing protein [Kordiimonas lacus]
MTADHSTEAYKAYFLGPKAENETWVRSEFQSILEHWFQWRKDLFPTDVPVSEKAERRTPAYLEARERIIAGLEDLTDLLDGEVPKFTPRYIGHMVSELTLPALMGHFAMILHNPNNTSRDSSKIGSRIEVEVIAMLAEMLGFDPERATGHITGGGTVANFEAVWRARFRQDHWLSLLLYLAEERGVTLDLFAGAHMGWKRFAELLDAHDVVLDDLRGYSGVATNPYAFGERMTQAFGQPYRGPVMLVPENKHFSWTKATNIFGYGEDAFWPVPLDALGKMDVAALEALIDRAHKEARPISMVVSVAGTTETGEIDPVDQVQGILNGANRRHGWDIWHHVDAAYGGFLCSLLRGKPSTVLSVSNSAALSAIGEAHSVTIDPHKLGYVPYSCGAIITRDEQAYAVSSFKAPYLERQLEVPDKWSTTLEGSRSAAGAAATWLTGKTMGFDTSGLGGVIAETILACRAFRKRIVAELPFVRPLSPSETNILCYSLAEEGMSLKAANAATEAVFDRFVACADFSVSKTTLSGKAHSKVIERHVKTFGGKMDDDRLVLIRCVFMNPFWREEAVADRLTTDIIAHLKDWFHPARAA